jgi:hypothetical protein
MLTQINDNKDTKLVLAGEVPILLGDYMQSRLLLEQFKLRNLSSEGSSIENLRKEGAPTSWK